MERPLFLIKNLKKLEYFANKHVSYKKSVVLSTDGLRYDEGNVIVAFLLLFSPNE